MQAWVVYESMFGNTEALAKAVGEGLARWAEASVVAVTAAPTVVGSEVDLLVVGAPTHALSLSRPTTRASAVEQGAAPVTPADRGVREWLNDVRFAGQTAVATFDSRVGRVPGSAAKAALRRLRRRGGTSVAPAESFGVAETPGPLIDGELDRARDWGVSLAAVVTRPAARP
jgi:hypothetical protein